MLHFCPQCNRNYDCNTEKLRQYAPMLPHGLQCGTPFEWRCPQCARKDIVLYGKSEGRFVDFAYTTSPAA